MENIGLEGIKKTIESIIAKAETMSDTEAPEDVESYLKGVNDTCWRNNIPIADYQTRIDTILGTSYAQNAEDLVERAFEGLEIATMGRNTENEQRFRTVNLPSNENLFIDDEGVVYMLREDTMEPHHLAQSAYKKIKEDDFKFTAKAPVRYGIIDASPGIKSVLIDQNGEAVCVATINKINEGGSYSLDVNRPDLVDISLDGDNLKVLLNVPSAQFGKRDYLFVGNDGMLFMLIDKESKFIWRHLNFPLKNDQINEVERDFYDVARRGFDKNILRKAIGYAMKSKTMSKEYFRENFIPYIRDKIKKSNSLFQDKKDNLEVRSYTLGKVEIPNGYFSES